MKFFCSPVLPQTHYAAEDDLELLILPHDKHYTGIDDEDLYTVVKTMCACGDRDDCAQQLHLPPELLVT